MTTRVVIALGGKGKLIARLHIPSLIVSYFLEEIGWYEKGICFACGSVGPVKFNVQNQVLIAFIAELGDESPGDEQAFTEGDFDRQGIGFESGRQGEEGAKKSEVSGHGWIL